MNLAYGDKRDKGHLGGPCPASRTEPLPAERPSRAETDLDRRALRELQGAASNVQGEVFARWAFKKLAHMGEYELARLSAKPV